MEISALQKARYEYAPKLPGMLRHGIADICVKEGEETQSVADQEIEEKVREHYGLKRKTPADAAAKSEKAATGKVEKSGADAKEQSLTEKE